MRGDVGDEAAHEAVDGLALRVVEPQRDEPGEGPLSYDVCLSHSRNLSVLSIYASADILCEWSLKTMTSWRPSSDRASVLP